MLLGISVSTSMGSAAHEDLLDVVESDRVETVEEEDDRGWGCGIVF